jgi:surfactin synthase thioesterase subunit
MRLIALPGLDGTGDLFRWLAREAPREFEVEAVAYPSDQALDYGGHLEIAR